MVVMRASEVALEGVDHSLGGELLVSAIAYCMRRTCAKAQAPGSEPTSAT